MLLNIEYVPPLTTNVKFGDIFIWDSESEQRDYIEESDSYKSFDEFLSGEINSVISNLSSIKL